MERPTIRRQSFSIPYPTPVKCSILYMVTGWSTYPHRLCLKLCRLAPWEHAEIKINTLPYREREREREGGGGREGGREREEDREREGRGGREGEGER